MESRYKYLYDEQAVHVAFMGAVQAYTTMFTRGVLSSETTMSNLSYELKAAQQRLNECHAMREQISAQDAQQIEGSCEGCMHFKCEYTEFPCCDCCRASRDDRYEKNSQHSIDVSLLGTYGEKIPAGERLCDFYPTLHSGEDANHET